MSILPDILARGRRIGVCGSAVGTASARAGAYYAGPGNRFWSMLHSVGLTPILLAPAEFRGVGAYGIGLTDIVKTAFGADSDLNAADFDCKGLRIKIETYQPAILAFNGKRAASGFLGGRVDYGYQHGRDIGATRLYVGPSTPGAARGFWNEEIWRTISEAARTYGSTADRDSGQYR